MTKRAVRDAAAIDTLTRERLFEAGTRLFAEHGLERVTVRQIAAAADANVAAVNYHFGSKADLYRAIVESAIRRMQETGARARAAGRGGTARERLHAYIRVYLARLRGPDAVSWIHKLVVRELHEPTDMLDRIAREVLEPRQAYLAGILGELGGVPADDPRVVRTAASVHAQIVFFGKRMPAPLARWRRVSHGLDTAADHITAFTLGGLEAVMTAPEAGRGGPPPTAGGRSRRTPAASRRRGRSSS